MNYRDLTPAIERDLVRRYKAGDRAAGQEILDAFDGVLWALAKRAVRGTPADFSDAQQTLRVCILEAASRFDESRGFRLSSYLSKYALRKLLNELRSDTTIVVKYDAFRRARAAERDGIEVPERIARRLSLRTVSSMDAEIERDGQSPITLHDVVADASPNPVDERASNIRRVEIVSALLAKLSEHEDAAVRGYFMRDEDTTYDALGDEFGVSRQAVQQRLARAMIKLRRTIRSVMTDGDAPLWGGRREPPSDADAAAPARARRDIRALRIELLRVLSGAGDSMGSSVVASMPADAGRRTVYAQLQALVERGFVAVRADDSRAQVKRYSLTDAGRAELAQIDGESALRSAA